MKTRVLIIIGIIMMTTIPLVTIAVLERHDNYLEQLEYERQRIDNEPKPGDKYYIEPERKAELEAVEIDLREKVRQLHKDIPFSSYAVNLDHQTKEIVVIVENKNLIPKIEEMTTQYPDDVSIIIINGNITLDEFLQDNVETEPEVVEERFYGLTKSQITDIQQAELGCKKIGNQTYCDISIQEKIDYYLQQNHGEIEHEK